MGDALYGDLVIAGARRSCGWSRSGIFLTGRTDQTMPYVPSPMKSSTRYAPSTTKCSSRWSILVGVSDFGLGSDHVFYGQPATTLPPNAGPPTPCPSISCSKCLLAEAHPIRLNVRGLRSNGRVETLTQTSCKLPMLSHRQRRRKSLGMWFRPSVLVHKSRQSFRHLRAHRTFY